MANSCIICVNSVEELTEPFVVAGVTFNPEVCYDPKLLSSRKSSFVVKEKTVLKCEGRIIDDIKKLKDLCLKNISIVSSIKCYKDGDKYHHIAVSEHEARVNVLRLKNETSGNVSWESMLYPIRGLHKGMTYAELRDSGIKVTPRDETLYKIACSLQGKQTLSNRPFEEVGVPNLVTVGNIDIINRLVYTIHRIITKLMKVYASTDLVYISALLKSCLYENGLNCTDDCRDQFMQLSKEVVEEWKHITMNVDVDKRWYIRHQNIIKCNPSLKLCNTLDFIYEAKLPLRSKEVDMCVAVCDYYGDILRSVKPLTKGQLFLRWYLEVSKLFFRVPDLGVEAEQLIAFIEMKVCGGEGVYGLTKEDMKLFMEQFDKYVDMLHEGFVLSFEDACAIKEIKVML